jgi:hypothetical protein
MIIIIQLFYRTSQTVTVTQLMLMYNPVQTDRMSLTLNLHGMATSLFQSLCSRIPLSLAPTIRSSAPPLQISSCNTQLVPMELPARLIDAQIASVLRPMLTAVLHLEEIPAQEVRFGVAAAHALRPLLPADFVQVFPLVQMVIVPMAPALLRLSALLLPLTPVLMAIVELLKMIVHLLSSVLQATLPALMR